MTLRLKKLQAEITINETTKSVEEKRKAITSFEKRHYYLKIKKQVQNLKAHCSWHYINTKFIRES